MANKINISELLKDCPSGMKLDCTMIDNVVFEKLDFISSHHPIIIRRTDSNKTIHLTKYGQYSDEEDYKCVIFPKGKTSWEGFIPPCKFKDGDIVFSGVNLISIFKCIKDGYRRSLHSYVSVADAVFKIDRDYWSLENIRFATEKEKEKLFKAIKDNGYKWNPETKTLDPDPKFKIGDRVKNKDNYTVSIVRINDEFYNYVSEGGECGIIYIKSQDDWELINKPKFKVGNKVRGKYTNNIYTISRITPTGYELTNGQSFTFDAEICHELVSENFDFSKLVPFESKVLVRNDNEQRWIPAFWGGIREDGYVTTFGWSKYCVPYEGNECLLDKNDDFYKTQE